MKPGNLLIFQGAKSGGRTKDEDSTYAHRIFGVRFFVAKNRK